MKFLSGLRFSNRRNPSSDSSSTAGRGIAQLLDDEDEDDFRTAATSSDWNLRGDDDDDDNNEISSSRGRYTDAAAAPSASTPTSSSSSSMRIRVVENDENHSAAAFVNDATSASSAAVAAAAVSVPATDGQRNTDIPPTDDCCPICFGGFVVPCRAPCGHWYCGGCILQYWNYGAALQPCNCPMCSRKITSLTPEASLLLKQEADVTEVLKNVWKYNRLFVGGLYGFILRLLESPLFIKRMIQDMMNPDRPGAHLNKLRIFAVKFIWTLLRIMNVERVLLVLTLYNCHHLESFINFMQMLMGLLYTISPFDFLRIGRQNVIDVFDYSAMALSLILYIVGIFLRRRRFQRVREIAADQD